VFLNKLLDVEIFVWSCVLTED